MNRRRKGLKPKEYGAIHTWLWKNYGKATYCENPDCQGRSTNYEWAMIHEKGYDFNRDNFMMLCKSCHCIYDMDEETKEQISVTLTGRTL